MRIPYEWIVDTALAGSIRTVIFSKKRKTIFIFLARVFGRAASWLKFAASYFCGEGLM